MDKKYSIVIPQIISKKSLKSFTLQIGKVERIENIHNGMFYSNKSKGYIFNDML